MVINADDYYGIEAFYKMHAWLTEKHEESAIAMAGFILKNTLSENGGVTRGVCKLEEGRTHIVDVVETSDIVKTVNPETGEVGAESDGIALNPESYVSMNMWGFPVEEGCIPDFMSVLEGEFKTFFETQVVNNPLKAEYLLPILIGERLRSGRCTVKVLET